MESAYTNYTALQRNNGESAMLCRFATCTVISAASHPMVTMGSCAWRQQTTTGDLCQTSPSA